MSLSNIFKKFFSFKGRLNRKPFAIRMATGYTLVFFIVVFLYEPFISRSKKYYTELIEFLPFIIVLWGAVWFMFANINRRFHDLGKSSLWTWCVFFSAKITIIYIPFILYLLLKKGDQGSNKYGEDVLSRATKVEPIVLSSHEPDQTIIDIPDDKAHPSFANEYATDTDKTMKVLEDLFALKEKGIITELEFEEKKSKILKEL